MKRTAVLIVLGISLIILVGVAYAYTTNDGDMFYDIANNVIDNSHDENLAAQSLFFTGCNPQAITYIKWDLSNVNGEVSSATLPSELIMEVTNISQENGNLVLYSVTDDSWDETEGPVPPLVAPALITPLDTIPVPSTIGPISFSSTALNTFLNQESLYVGGDDTWAGDDVASLAIQVEDCDLFGLNGVFMGDREDGPPPLLNLYDPSAIELQIMSASSDSDNTTLILIVLVASVVLILVGAFIYRRRVHQS